MSTIGYGGAIPTSLYGELIATLESLVGLVFTALSTGMTFARLSRPTAQIVFSDVFLYSETDIGPALIFEDSLMQEVMILSRLKLQLV